MKLKGSKQAVSRNRDDGAGASARAFDPGTSPLVTVFAAGVPWARRDSWKRIGKLIVAVGWKRLPKRSQQPKQDLRWRRVVRALSRQWRDYLVDWYCSVPLVFRCFEKIELRTVLSQIPSQRIIVHRHIYFVQDLFTMRFLQQEGRRVQRPGITGACTLARISDSPR